MTLDERIKELLREAVRDEVRAAMREATASAILSTEEAAEIAGVTAKTVRTWVEEQKLPAGNRGRKLAIKRQDLESFLAGGPRRTPPTGGRSTQSILASLGAK